MNFPKQCVGALAIASQILSLSAPGATFGSGQIVSVGVGRLGTFSGQKERAYSILESQVRRWLENTGNEAVRFQTVEASAPTSEINRLWVEAVADTALEAAIEGHASSARPLTSEKWAELEAKLRSPGLPGSPSVQKGYVALAARAWMKGDKEQSRTFLKKAAAVHPDGKIEFRARWPEDAAYDWNAFEEEAALQSRALKPLCQVSLVETEPAGLQGGLSVNGFAVGTGRLRLHAGQFMVTRTGLAPESQVFRCERSGRYQIKLVASPAVPQAALGGVAAGTMFLIEPHGDEFRFYLFTRGVGVDEVPVNQPVSVSGLLAQSQNQAVEIPVSTDAFLEIFQKHQAASDPISVATNSYSETSTLSLQRPPAETPWYKSWTFWTVVGAVAVTAVVVGVSSAHSGVEANPQGLRLTFE